MQLKFFIRICCLQTFSTCSVFTALISAAVTLLVQTLLLLNPPVSGSEVRLSLFAGTFYLIKVQPKWNLRNSGIWSQPGPCYFLSDVLWLRLRRENRSRAAAKTDTLSADRSQLTNNQWNYNSEQHSANTVNSNKNRIKTLETGARRHTRGGHGVHRLNSGLRFIQ